MPYVYLASPYSDPRPSMVSWRFKKNRRALFELTQVGLNVFSPVVVGHQLSELGVIKTHQGWMDWCMDFLTPVKRVYVLTLPGWEDSKGLGMELRWASQHRVPVITCDILPDCEQVSAFDVLGAFGLPGTIDWDKPIDKPG